MSFRWPPPEELTKEEIEELLRVPSVFSISSDHPVSTHPDQWSLGPSILTRDSGLLDKSNAAVLEEALKKRHQFRDQWCITRCHHWACGWVDHLTFKVLTKKAKPTAIYKFLAVWFRALEDYSVADDDDYSRREREATLGNIRYGGQRIAHRTDAEFPDGWEYKVARWLGENDPDALASIDDKGGYPSEDQLKKAMRALCYLDEEYEG